MKQMPFFYDEARDMAQYREQLPLELQDHDEAGAIAWAQTETPPDGARRGEFFMRGGQLWSEGRYLGEDGDNAPHVVWPTSNQPADADGRAR